MIIYIYLKIILIIFAIYNKVDVNNEDLLSNNSNYIF